MLLNTPLCNFNWQAPDFSLSTAAGEYYTLQSSMGKNGLVIAFICNHCPYVLALMDRLAADAKTLQTEGINTLAIMSNDYTAYPEDSPKHMGAFAQRFGLTFPYVADETQEVAKAYEAVCTPDFFGLNTKGELQYRGRLDDLGMSDNDASNRTPELLNAMRLVAQTGQGPQQQTASMGCSIKWKN